jgi:hypothetical protein
MESDGDSSSNNGSEMSDSEEEELESGGWIPAVNTIA